MWVKESLKVPQEGSFATLDEAVSEVKEQAKEIESAKATTKVLKEEGVVDIALVLLIRWDEVSESEITRDTIRAGARMPRSIQEKS
ncbi:hypothetical protein SOVF_044340 [Spinacia oleracea]|nr:hypothetical protein SOVF_044340 [Spinacia oleracea]